MKSLKEIKELVEKARSLQEESTGLYRVFQEDYRKEKTSIEMNKDYSQEGKRKLVESLQKRKTVELLQGARNLKNLHSKYLSEAKDAAQNIVHAKTPDVDPVKEERFLKRLGEVKTEILLSNAKKGKEILTEFLNTVDEQAFAGKIKDEFSTLIQPILSDGGQDTAKFRRELFDVFEDVKNRSMHPEAREAMEIAEFAEASIKSRFFIPLVEEKATEHLGKEAGLFINKPDEFFEKYPDADIKLPPNGIKTIEQIMEEEEAKTL